VGVKGINESYYSEGVRIILSQVTL